MSKCLRMAAILISMQIAFWSQTTIIITFTQRKQIALKDTYLEPKFIIQYNTHPDMISNHTQCSEKPTTKCLIENQPNCAAAEETNVRQIVECSMIARTISSYHTVVLSLCRGLNQSVPRDQKVVDFFHDQNTDTDYVSVFRWFGSRESQHSLQQNFSLYYLCDMNTDTKS